jgi:hypothetical protein
LVIRRKGRGGACVRLLADGSLYSCSSRGMRTCVAWFLDADFKAGGRTSWSRSLDGEDALASLLGYNSASQEQQSGADGGSAHGGGGVCWEVRGER